MSRKINVIAVSMLAVCVAVSVAGNAAAAGDPDDPQGNDANLYTHTSRVNGLVVRIRVRHPSADVARKALVDANEEIQRIYRKLDANDRSSEIGGVNAAGGTEEVIVSTETRAVLAKALKYCRLTGRAFDPTLKSFDYLWAFGRKPFVAPLADEVQARAALTGCEHIILKSDRAVRLGNDAVRISVAELTAGHAMARVGALLDAAGVGSFVLKIGRDQYVRGSNGTRHWYVTVGQPRAAATPLAQVYVNSTAIATRTIFDLTVMRNGKRYHDALDPRTGMPARGVLQATVMASDPVLADALSYALLILGPKAGLELAASLEQKVDVFIIDASGQVHASASVRDRMPKLPPRVGVP